LLGASIEHASLLRCDVCSLSNRVCLSLFLINWLTSTSISTTTTTLQQLSVFTRSITKYADVIVAGVATTMTQETHQGYDDDQTQIIISLTEMMVSATRTSNNFSSSLHSLSPFSSRPK
jgi:hypothetical protein